jgi:hypothetical protein
MNEEARAHAGARAAVGRAATGRAAATVSIMTCVVARESVVGGLMRAGMCVAPGRSDVTRASIPSEVGTARREPSKRRNRDVSLSIAAY